MVDNFDKEKYIDKGIYEINIDTNSKLGDKLRCIDDRSSGLEDVGRDIAVPGSGLGVVMDAIGALTILRRRGKHVSIPAEKIIDVVEDVLGVILYHTDKKSVDNGGIPCAGCNHLAGAIADPVKYLISETDSKYFSGEGILALESKLKEKKIHPAIYEGRHAAKAVIIVDGLDIGVLSRISSGEQVYVYHESYHKLILGEVAKGLHKLMEKNSKEITLEEVEDAIILAAKERLNVTFDKLAHDLPIIKVNKQTKIFTEIIKP